MIDLSNHCNHSDCPHYVYITLGINERKGFFYIGQHKCKRVGEHDSGYYGSGKIIQNIKKKYGFQYVIDNFRNIPIWWCKSKQEADDMELMFIDYYDSVNIGCNLTDKQVGYSDKPHTGLSGSANPFFGKHHTEETKAILRTKCTTYGMLGKHHSEEFKKSLSAKRKEMYKNPEFAEKMKQCIKPHIYTEEEKKALSEKMKGVNNPFFGKHHSEETKNKLRGPRYHLRGENSFMYGKHLSEETKRKLRLANIGKKRSEESCKKQSERVSGKNNPMYGTKRPQYVIDACRKANWKGNYEAYKDGIKVGEFDSWEKIAEFLGKSNIQSLHSTIGDNVNGRTKSAYGYQWKRLPKEES